MKKYNGLLILAGVLSIYSSCGKKDDTPDPAPLPPSPMYMTAARFNNTVPNTSSANYNIPVNAAMRLTFDHVVDRSTVAAGVSLKENAVTDVPLNVAYENGDSTLLLSASSTLKYLTRYTLAATGQLKSKQGGVLSTPVSIQFITQLDSSNKFPLISDNALLDKVQQETFKYFWDYGHPVSGLARERSNSGPETVTSGGSGFGVMCIVAGIDRGFITRAQGLSRMQTIVGFLKNTAQKFHGAFPHWLNGSTGVVIPFSANDNGADLVETSYLMMGLLTARQYFNGADATETTLRADINSIYNGVEWSWFRKSGEQQLYWHWSPTVNWTMNMPIRGWNECLITYVMAASSTTFGIPSTVYNQGWTQNGGTGFVNGSSYLGHTLPLGPAYGGPLFFSHYSFLGINPNGLTDTYANYFTQVKNHTLINYTYCVNNPLARYGYSNSCWGLTASDIPGGYSASSPTNDLGVISPTAALSSFPYTPTESMRALKFFYYTLGDKLWGQYGFKDAFSLKDIWFADSYLAIDQGPIMVMIENYRSGLLWNLFTSCPEVKNGMRTVLGFQAPYL